MNRTTLILLTVGALLVSAALAQFKTFRDLLTGYEEVPAVSTTASGEFSLTIESPTSLAYRLSYAGLEADITQSHIHFGQAGVIGGVSVWLCSNLPSPPTPPGVQPCPAPPATIQGTITAANVVGPTEQGIAPGEFSELLDAIRAGVAYVNVHSTKFPVGEIRAQIDPGRGR